MNIYSIRDDSAQYFLPPLFARTDGQAKRMFIGSLGDSFPFRKDFGLYLIGTFDEQTGLLTTQEPSIVLAGFSIPSESSPAFVPSPKPQMEAPTS